MAGAAAGAALDADRVEHRLDVLTLVRLPRAEDDREGQPGAVSDRIELGREPAAAAAQGVVGGPVGARLLRRASYSPRPGGMAMRSDGGAVDDTSQLPIELVRGIEVALECVENAVPASLARPPPEARRYGRPGAVALWEIAPGDADRVAVEHPVDDATVLAIVGFLPSRAAAAAGRSAPTLPCPAHDYAPCSPSGTNDAPTPGHPLSHRALRCYSSWVGTPIAG